MEEAFAYIEEEDSESVVRGRGKTGNLTLEKNIEWEHPILWL